MKLCIADRWLVLFSKAGAWTPFENFKKIHPCFIDRQKILTFYRVVFLYMDSIHNSLAYDSVVILYLVHCMYGPMSKQ